MTKRLAIAISVLIMGLGYWLFSQSSHELGANMQEPESSRVIENLATSGEKPESTSHAALSIDDTLTDKVPEEVKLDFEEGDIIYQRGDYVERRLVVRNCHPEVVSAYTDQGLVNMTVPRCEKVLEYLHPYGDLDHDALAVLAEYDGVAALIFAEKMALTRPNDPIVTDLFVHAFALSDETQAFEALFNYAGGHGLAYANGELDVERASNSFVWSSIGERVGLRDSSDVDAYRNALSMAGADVDKLDRKVEQTVASIRDRRRTMQIGEASL